jgi:hypothetical protein
MATQPTNTNASAAPASGGETFQERLILMNKALLNDLLKVQTGIPRDRGHRYGRAYRYAE